MRHRFRHCASAVLIATLAPKLLLALPPAKRFEIRFTSAAHSAPVTGRLILIVSKTAQPEPRMLVSPSGPAIFGVDLDQQRPDQPIVVDNAAVGYPTSLAELPAGDYHVQAMIDVYTQVHRADGHTIWVRINDGRIEPFQIAAGNLYSDPKRVHIWDMLGMPGRGRGS